MSGPSRGGIQPSRGFELDGRHVRLRIFPNGTGTATFTQTGGVSTVARTAAGTFLITLQDAYKVVASATATVQHTTAVALYPQFGDVSNVGTASDATVVLRIVNGSGTATDMTANANSSIGVDLCFEVSRSNNSATYA